jgi:hypothetical protein
MEIQVAQQGNLFVNKDFSEFLHASGLDSFDDFMRLEGMVVKSAVRERLTQRLDLEGVTVYVKKHFFPGIREILKNFLRFRFPLGALNEWRAENLFFGKSKRNRFSLPMIWVILLV